MSESQTKRQKLYDKQYVAFKKKGLSDNEIFNWSNKEFAFIQDWKRHLESK